MPLETTVVIPAFNESKRLPATLENLERHIKSNALAPLNVSAVTIVDDGSADDTAKVALAFRTRLPDLKVIQLGRNRGKGFAVRTGVQNAKTEWVLFSDADEAYPWQEAVNLAKAAIAESASVVLGSRGIKESEGKVRRSPLRHWMGIIFNLVVRTITGLPFRDTQCGFKLIKAKDLRTSLPLLQVDRFAWDVEFLLLAQKLKLKIVETAVVCNMAGQSSVRPVRDGLSMLWQTLKARQRLK